MDFFKPILGIALLLTLAFFMSEDKKAINWKIVIRSFISFIILTFMLDYIPFTRDIVLMISNQLNALIGHANAGLEFVFGPLMTKLGFSFIINVLGVIMFTSALISLLYFLNILPFIVLIIGSMIGKLTGVSKIESFCSTTNIFLGYTEASLIVKPYLNTMSPSAIFVVMTAGMASVSGSALVGYIGLGVETSYLVTSSFLTSIGALIMAKIMVPGTDKEEFDPRKTEPYTDAKDVIGAISNGAMLGVQLIIAIAAVLVAFVALLHLINSAFSSLGHFLHIPFDTSLNSLLSFVFYPVVWLMGIDSESIGKVAFLLGEKVATNEFIAFMDFMKIKAQLSESTQKIATFALCGFANIASSAILVGAISPLLKPERAILVRKYAIKSVFAAFFANLLNAFVISIILNF